MTPDRLRECLATLGWSQRGLASTLKINDRQVRRWAAGEAVVPVELAHWIELMARIHDMNPPPRRAEGQPKEEPSP